MAETARRRARSRSTSASPTARAPRSRAPRGCSPRRRRPAGSIPADIDEDALARRLYTAHWPDPDLLIRTSGEMRISNFLLWQLAYAELYVTPVLWPDFTRRHLFEAILDFSGATGGSAASRSDGRQSGPARRVRRRRDPARPRLVWYGGLPLAVLLARRRRARHPGAVRSAPSGSGVRPARIARARQRGRRRSADRLRGDRGARRSAPWSTQAWPYAAALWLIALLTWALPRARRPSGRSPRSA